MKTPALAGLLSLPLLLVPFAVAQHRTFTVQPDASQVAFNLGASDHPVQGTFHVQSGSIDFDLNAPKISGSVVVAAGSGSSGNDSRDKKMTKDVLEAPHFTDVSFVPRSYQGTVAPSGGSSIQVTGTFTLHGTPHDLTVPMQINIEGDKLTAKTHFTVPFVQWGLKDPSFFMFKVDKEVGIDLTLVGHVSDSH
jgi:polyisoprenoid-binding protein YceI